MAATKRVSKELKAIMDAPVNCVSDVACDEDNMLKWSAVLIPSEEPYNKASFQFLIDFPAKYPFAPPKITFQTKLYHPNVDESGAVCLQIIDPSNWKPAVKIATVLGSLVSLIHEPEPDHPLRQDLAELFVKDRAEFNKMAVAESIAHGIKRA